MRLQGEDCRARGRIVRPHQLPDALFDCLSLRRERGARIKLPDSLQSTIQQAIPYPIQFASITGSHVFGYASPYSDLDVHGMYILPLREVLGLKKPRDVMSEVKMEHPEDGREIDGHFYDIRHAIHYLLKGNGNFLEDIFSPLTVISSPLHEELQALVKQHCLSRMSAAHYKGMSYAQQRKMKNNEVKKLLHQYRCLLTGLNFMLSGKLVIDVPTLAEFYQQPQVFDLIDYKLSAVSDAPLSADVIAMHTTHTEALVMLLDEAFEKSPLPICPSDESIEVMEAFLYRVRLENR